MDLLRNVPLRFIIAAVLVFLSLALHMTAWAADVPIDEILIYLIFVGYAWAATKFGMPFLGKSFLFAIPAALIPPIVLLPLRNTLDSIQISWIIGICMTIYGGFMVGWMLQAYDRAQGSSAPTPAA